MDKYDFDVISLFGGTNDAWWDETLYPGGVGTADDVPYVDDVSTFADPSKYTDEYSDNLTFMQFYKGCIEMLNKIKDDDMTTNSKEWIQYGTASLMILSGVVLTFISFFVNGDVTEGVLWYMAQALTYAGGIFGVSIYFRTKLGSSITEIKDIIDRKFSEIRKEELNNESLIKEREQGQ